MKNYDVFIGVDVGLSGSIAIFDEKGELSFHKMPIKKITVNKKDKNVYDMEKIVDILDIYRGKSVLFCIERQGVRPGEGSVSAMTIGKGFGQLLGVSFAMRFNVVEVMSQSWKKYFPGLNTKEIADIRELVKNKKIEIKTLKDKKQKKENKKQIDKLSASIKVKAKEAARCIVSNLYPSHKDFFLKKNTDGVAESILIAIFGKDFLSKAQNELV